MKPAFIITVDVEGDNLWNHPKTITTKNARFLSRFQHLCESYGFKPTYLTNYEMAIDKEFQAFGHAVLDRNAAEIGAHLHAWNSPPLAENKEWQDFGIYITELPDYLIREKLKFITKLLTETFKARPVSHRGGRWAIDERVASQLIELGYLVDCTVTPGVSWHQRRTLHGREPNYLGFGIRPYFLDLKDIRRPGNSILLEVPVTIRPSYHPFVQTTYHSIAKRSELAARGVSKMIGEPYVWLRPSAHARNLKDMLNLVDWALRQKLPVMEFMLHSSELMPGGSPYFPNDADIKQLYVVLDKLFHYVASRGIMGNTLADFRDVMVKIGPT